MLRRQRADVAGADDQHAPAVEPVEDLARDRHRFEADRDGAFAERRLRAHPLADDERAIEQAAQQRADAVTLGRLVKRLLHLPENLRLADDGRIESGGDAEQMRHRLRVPRARTDVR